MAHVIETLYGVVHGGYEIVSNYGLIERGRSLYIPPSQGLLEELADLPAGTKVGIEYHPEILQFNVDQVVTRYWRRINHECSRYGLEVVYLEDMDTYGRYVEKAMESRELYDQLGQRDIFDDVTRLREGIYKAGVEGQYAFEVEREESILAKVIESGAQVVAIGRGHSDYLMLSGSELRERGVVVKRYMQEVPDVSEYPWEIVSDLVDGTPDQRFIVDRDILLRNRRAVQTRRILPDQIPQFIGTWKVGCPVEGLFEVYVEDDQYRYGRIEDGLGKATFEGEITPRKIRIVKMYDPEWSRTDEKGLRILYEGEMSDGKYKGLYGVVDDERYGKGRFVMNAEGDLEI